MPLLFSAGSASNIERSPPTRYAVDRPGAQRTNVTDAAGKPLRFTPHDFRRMFITDAVMHGMPPQSPNWSRSSRYQHDHGIQGRLPEEVINGHRAFIARRRELRPSAEYRVPTEQEWGEFSAIRTTQGRLGTCGRSYATACIHEHACLRCPLLRPDPAQRPRLIEVRDNLIARVAEARQEGWLGEVDGLQISLDGARQKMDQIEQMTARAADATSTRHLLPDCRPHHNRRRNRTTTNDPIR